LSIVVINFISWDLLPPQVSDKDLDVTRLQQVDKMMNKLKSLFGCKLLKPDLVKLLHDKCVQVVIMNKATFQLKLEKLNC
jgi:hypothetical protein